MFEIRSRDAASRARTGIITTPHGIIETPSYVVVGTNAAVRCLEPEDIPATGTQAIIANAYHLWRDLGDDGLASWPGLHAVLGWNGPVMTDSGGFQVFSLGASREHRVGKKETSPEPSEYRTGESLVRVTESGVYFKDADFLGRAANISMDGEEEYLDAELSVRIQEQLGADIIFAFDEPSSPHHDRAYTKEAMERTHRWALRSLEAKASRQAMYGIVQGGAFEDLRNESARVIGALPFDGFGIGGAFGSSYGSEKEDTFRELDWTIPFLPETKPRHLLGIGRIEDLFRGVEAGVDTFDCVIPTREARHGSIWTREGRFDIKKGSVAGDDRSLEDGCSCAACASGLSRGGLYEFFKAKSPDAPRFATMHNIFFFNDLMRRIRESIADASFGKLKKEYLARSKKNERLR